MSLCQVFITEMEEQRIVPLSCPRPTMALSGTAHCIRRPPSDVPSPNAAQSLSSDDVGTI